MTVVRQLGTLKSSMTTVTACVGRWIPSMLCATATMVRPMAVESLSMDASIRTAKCSSARYLSLSSVSCNQSHLARAHRSSRMLVVVDLGASTIHHSATHRHTLTCADISRMTVVVNTRITPVSTVQQSHDWHRPLRWQPIVHLIASFPYSQPAGASGQLRTCRSLSHAVGRIHFSRMFGGITLYT